MKIIVIKALAFILLIYTNMVYPQKEITVTIETSMGNLVVKLYNQTPLHRDNFIKLVNDKFYEGLLFHRVISNFMIQGGDPDSRNATPGTMLGNGGPGYQVTAEFRPGLFHKKGALAAARQGDNVNPEKKSSGSQFYIVQGSVFTNDQLNMMEKKMNDQLKNQLMMEYVNQSAQKALKNKIDSLVKINDQTTLNQVGLEIESKIAHQLTPDKQFRFSEEQRKIYTTIGGTPHLDGAYTVFGEVISGIETVDKIAAVATDKNNRPVDDVKIIKMTINK